MARWRSLPVFVALLAASGCSFAFVTPAPAGPPRAAPVDCTSSVALPVVDTFLAAAAAAAGTHEIFRTDVDAYTEGFRTGLIGASTVGALLWAGSAYYGFTRSNACREAQAEVAGQPRR